MRRAAAKAARDVGAAVNATRSGPGSVECEGCGRAFTPTRKGHAHCGGACRSLASRRSQAAALLLARGVLALATFAIHQGDTEGAVRLVIMTHRALNEGPHGPTP